MTLPSTAVQEAVELRIADLKIDAAVQIRESTNEDQIVRYEDVLHRLPPIDVFRVPDGDVLVSDGFHRLAAHQRQGKTTIKAFIHEGTREEALEYAVVANVSHGMPLKPTEISAGIRRLHLMHPDWSNEKLAGLMQCSENQVGRVLRAQDVRRSLVGWKPADRISDRTLSVVAALPEESYQSAIKAADKLKLTQEGLEALVKNVLDPKVTDDQKRLLLAGEALPKVKTEDGQMKTPVSLVTREARASAVWVAEPDPVGDDVAERLKTPRFDIELRYQLPSDKTRTRGLYTYKRESENLTRRWTINLGPEALEYNPRQLIEDMARKLLKIVNWEGYPVQTAIAEARPQ